MPPAQQTGQKRKRSTPYEGRKSTRKPKKFKKQEYYHSSSSEDEEEELIPEWRNSTITKSAGDEPGIEADEDAKQRPQQSGEDKAPITFSDLVTQVTNTAVDSKQAGEAETGKVLDEFDPWGPVELSDDEFYGDGDETKTQKSASHTTKMAQENKKFDQEITDDIMEEDGEDEEVSGEEDDDDGGEEEGSSDDDGTTTNASTTTRALRKRNDPAAFAASISAILGSKLTSTKRADPVLARSASAAAIAKEITEDKLEAKARRKLKADKQALSEKGRVKDVLGLDKSDQEFIALDTGDSSISTGALIEKEKQLRKTAQRGVVKLFNAVRAAQMKGFEAEYQSRREGKIGIDGRKARVDEMSKKGFLDLLAGGG